MFLARRTVSRAFAPSSAVLQRSFHTSRALHKVEVPTRPKHVADDDIEEEFLKGSGPGGQKINKTSSAVQLKHLPTGIVVKVQSSRSRSLNRILARKRLAEQIDLAENKEDSWMNKKQEAQSKRKAKKSQKSRAKYRRLEEEKQQQQQQQETRASGEGSEDSNATSDGHR